MYEDIIKAKKAFDESILNAIKDVIEKTVQDAEKQNLNAIQTFINIQTNIDEELRAIKLSCGMYEYERLNEDLDIRIEELTDPFDQKKNECIQTYIDELFNSYDIKELFKNYKILHDIVDSVKKWGSNPYEIVVNPEPKVKTKERKKHLK